MLRVGDIVYFVHPPVGCTNLGRHPFRVTGTYDGPKRSCTSVGITPHTFITPAILDPHDMLHPVDAEHGWGITRFALLTPRTLYRRD